MPYFINPFHKHDVSEFPGVYVPLESSARGNSVVAENGGKLPSASDSKPESLGDGGEKGRPIVDAKGALTLDALRHEVDADIAASGHDSVYDRKSKVINKAIQDIGMGRYQWALFVLAGFGWLADNLWLQTVALTLDPIAQEFGVNSNNVRFTTCALFVGLCLGASFWGIASDVVGRRLAFNATLFIAGVFGLAVGGAPNWIGACGMYAALGFGVGGNLPVDGALFLEFLPNASASLLTALSVWWPVGQLIASLIAWGFVPNYSCADQLISCDLTAPGEACCSRADNMGWRYLVLTSGALTLFMFACRFFLFHLFESPKFLLSKGRQAEAVAVVHGIAYRNGGHTWLSEDILNDIGGTSADDMNLAADRLTIKQVVLRFFGKFSKERIAPLFSSKRLGWMTFLIWLTWATIGMGYPLFNAFLPQYLRNSGKGEAETSTYLVYRNYAITSVVGVPGSIIAWYTVDIKWIGRKGTIATSALITGILLFIFTIKSDQGFQTTISSLEAFFQNIMYGVLYAMTPEVFPAPNRGTGTGIASFFNRLCGLFAPIVAVYAGSANPSAPVFASGALILAAFVCMCLYPIETRGKQFL